MRRQSGWPWTRFLLPPWNRRPAGMPSTAATAKNEALMWYWFAALGSFKDLAMLHIASDANSLGEKSKAAGFVALPSNVAVIPPVEHDWTLPLEEEI